MPSARARWSRCGPRATLDGHLGPPPHRAGGHQPPDQRAQVRRRARRWSIAVPGTSGSVTCHHLRRGPGHPRVRVRSASSGASSARLRFGTSVVSGWGCTSPGRSSRRTAARSVSRRGRPAGRRSSSSGCRGSTGAETRDEPHRPGGRGRRGHPAGAGGDPRGARVSAPWGWARGGGPRRTCPGDRAALPHPPGSDDAGDGRGRVPGGQRNGPAHRLHPGGACSRRTGISTARGRAGRGLGAQASPRTCASW